MTDRRVPRSAGWVLCGWLLLSVACATPEARVIEGAKIEQVEGYEDAVKEIQADATGFLRKCLARTAAVRQFTMEFERQERLGVFKELKPAENIFAEFRDEPFSVRFTWRDEDSEYLQCVYVEGKDENKVVILPRAGLLGMPPAPQKYPVNWAVLFHKSRNPITDFGPKRMLERTIDRIEKAKKVGEVKIAAHDATEIGSHKEPCIHLEIRYPKGDEFPCKLQDLYLHAQTQIPVATRLWLPGKVERSTSTLDASYVYSNLDSSVQLTDANFAIDKVAEKRQAAVAGKDRDGDGAGTGVERGVAGE